MEILTYSVPTWIPILIVLFITYIIYMSWNFRMFTKMGVQGPTPLPVFGNFIQQGKMGLMKADETWMKQYGNVWGIFDGRSPNLFIADEEMLKELFVKKFHDFTDRRVVEGANGDLESALTALKGEHWKMVRNLLTPTFSAGKLKRMSPLITQASNLLLEHIEKKCTENKEVEMKSVFGAYTMDVISSTAFGIKTDAQKDPKNPFVQNVAKFVDVNFTSPILIMLFIAPFLLKPLNKLTGISLLSKDVQRFFRRVLVNEINNRKTEREDYVDFMQLMIKAHDENPESTRKGMTFDEILGNSLIFFFAGYETTATTLCFLSYNMALHPEIQQKVFEEIDRELGDESADYDNIHKLEYLDMCVNETLRMFPPATRLDRVCVNDSEIKRIHIPKGMIVSVPIWAIHRSPENWPDPLKFDPERFSPENKGKISPYHFIPFGYGPRNCIGMRLALLELKIAFAGVIRKYKFSVGSKTQIPPKMNDLGVISPKSLWLNVDKR